MIPEIYLIQWKKNSPWFNDYQVEQDLIIERALAEIFSDKQLAQQLAFRGGTALHKLILKPQSRYSEDIDLVQIKAGAIGEIISRLREKMSFLGEAKYFYSNNNVKLIYKFESEAEPKTVMKLKIEINTREHNSVFDFRHINHELKNDWFNKSSEITTYTTEELLSTKLRALYQRRKGRDLFDLYYAYQSAKLDTLRLLEGFTKYLSNENIFIQRKEFEGNLIRKIKDKDFIGDTKALLRTNIEYNHIIAYNFIMNEIISKMPP